ncbi:MAG: UbiA-like protein EboC [Bacteroidota bacterium]
MKTLLAYLRLTRPANLPTAVADVALGFAVSGSIYLGTSEIFPEVMASRLVKFPWLVLSTIGLYGGGVVLNDVFDYELDKVERPERPLPQGDASLSGAILLGVLLLIAGIFSAAQVNTYAFYISLIISALVISYDYWAKHHIFWGPFNMGACRGFNLLLGISIYPPILFSYYPLALIPIVYIAAITLVSQGEVRGGNRPALYLALGLYVSVIIGIGLSIQSLGKLFWHSFPFLVLFSFLTIRPLLAAIKDPVAKNVFKAVKFGVLSLVVMDAALAAGFAGWFYGILVLTLLLLSLVLAKLFAVT